MTILLTSCSTEAHNSIININKYITKYDNDTFDVNFDIEGIADLLDENHKLEGQIFIDLPFFKRYSKLYELKNRIKDNSIESTNKYYMLQQLQNITNY